MANVKQQPQPTRKFQSISDVVGLLEEIHNGVSNGLMTEANAKIHLGVSKQLISVANIVMQQRRLNAGKKAESDLLLSSDSSLSETKNVCGRCSHDISGMKFCANCGNAIAAAISAAV